MKIKRGVVLAVAGSLAVGYFWGVLSLRLMVFPYPQIRSVLAATGLYRPIAAGGGSGFHRKNARAAPGNTDVLASLPYLSASEDTDTSITGVITHQEGLAWSGFNERVLRLEGNRRGEA
jgi:hypothetical protein